MPHIAQGSLHFSFPRLAREIEGLIAIFLEENSARFRGQFAESARKTLLEHFETEEQIPVQTLLRLQGLRGPEIESAWVEAWQEVVRNLQLSCEVSFERTLRLPDDGKVYPLPAGLGSFPIRPVDHYTSTAPAEWIEQGGVLLPMYQGEAFWMSFQAGIPTALKITCGSVNALTGDPDHGALSSTPQNYLTLPDQPWLDGFQVSSGVVRQFVAVPTGAGLSASEQLAPERLSHGMVIEAIPLKAEQLLPDLLEEHEDDVFDRVMRRLLGDWDHRSTALYARLRAPSASLGVGGGGKIQQEIYEDPHGVDAWNQADSIRVCVHICNSALWRAITHENPPHPPFTPEEYRRKGIPWFDFYRDDLEPLPETKKMASLKSVDEVAHAPNASVHSGEVIEPGLVIQYGNTRRPEAVRQWGGAFKS
ncbi:MAG: hypothetical protein SFU53_14930 [Terrimicrobiaceae bacterium]|nr:hypothetical protein [Terrimicrobiaceae bacterium]